MNLKAASPVANDPVLQCPNCNHPIRLTESLAAPLIEETRKRFQKQLAEKDTEVCQKLDMLRRERDDLAKARQGIDEQVRQRLENERAGIASAEAKKARTAAATELKAKDEEAAELRRALEINDAKVAEAQRDHAELLRKGRELDDSKRELELTIERRVQATVDDVRAKAKQEADESVRLRLLEREQTIDSMARTIENLKRTAEQGSQQSQGEAQLGDATNIAPVPASEHSLYVLSRGLVGTSKMSSGVFDRSRRAGWNVRE